jgi:hypothetical protein
MVSLLLNFTLAIFHEERNYIYRVLGHLWPYLGHGKKGKKKGKTERELSQLALWSFRHSTGRAAH